MCRRSSAARAAKPWASVLSSSERPLRSRAIDRVGVARECHPSDGFPTAHGFLMAIPCGAFSDENIQNMKNNSISLRRVSLTTCPVLS